VSSAKLDGLAGRRASASDPPPSPLPQAGGGTASSAKGVVAQADPAQLIAGAVMLAIGVPFYLVFGPRRARRPS